MLKVSVERKKQGEMGRQGNNFLIFPVKEKVVQGLKETPISKCSSFYKKKLS